MARQKLVADAVPCLVRVHSVHKSSSGSSRERLLPKEHYDSMSVEPSLVHPDNILLVDDILTMGSTLLGAANRVAKIYPDACIRGFVAMRTVGRIYKFREVWDPDITFVTLSSDGKAYRRS